MGQGRGHLPPARDVGDEAAKTAARLRGQFVAVEQGCGGDQQGLLRCPCVAVDGRDRLNDQRLTSVLSIGKLAAGQAKYYLDQAEVRVDVVESVGDGIEDYYVGAARGARASGSARRRASSGSAARSRPTALRRVLAGLDPRDGSPLRTSSSRARVAGFDLTFSAPKSVSVLFGLGDDELRRRVREAHDVAVREAVGYLERSAAAVRRGHGGAIVEEASGLVAAAFRHRTSRAGDPQLHTHVLVANLGARAGRAVVGARRAAAVRARAGGELHLPGGAARRADADGRASSGRRCATGSPRSSACRGRCCGRSAGGGPRSRRRSTERGTSGPRAAEAAALATRRAKDARVTAETLVAEWRARAAELGFGQRGARAAASAASARAALDDADWQRLCRASGRPDRAHAPARRRSRAATSSRRCARRSRPARWSTRGRSSAPRRVPRVTRAWR